MSRFAGFCVQQAIGRRLRGSHVGIVYDYSVTVPQPPRIVPATTLGAVYLELDNKLRAKHRSAGRPNPDFARGQAAGIRSRRGGEIEPAAGTSAPKPPTALA